MYYSLTDKAKIKHSLKILGREEKILKRTRLYQLLIFFEIYKNTICNSMNFWSSKLLATFLKCIGLSANNLKISEMSRFSDNILMVVFKPIKGVEIFGLSEYSSQTKSIFYVMVPGFSIEEFITYLEVLRTQKMSIRLPTPFIFLPFLTYIVQTEKELSILVP